MYTVALVQNQSEMAHYSHADARPLVTELGYSYKLYTAANIDELSGDLHRYPIDAVMIGSNALNDKAIRQEILSDKFSASLDKFLNNGKGLIVFMQLRLATLGDLSTFSFLPSSLNSIRAKVRPQIEQAGAGSLCIQESASKHLTILYPNRVSVSLLENDAKGFRSLPGLYWHYLDNVNASEWDVLISDVADANFYRPLIAASKETLSYRVIVSALPLDWQRQRKLFQNYLIFIVEGRHNTAILADDKITNTAFDYLGSTLLSRKFPFRRYFISQDLNVMASNISDSVHTTLVLGPYISRERLPDGVSDIIRERVNTGVLKLLSVEPETDGVRRFSVSGRERYAYRLLQRFELQVQAELRGGYVDGSFWSTVETLQNLKEIIDIFPRYRSWMEKTILISSEHDRNGSYDEVFGASCALCWIRANYYGSSSKETMETVEWIRGCINKYEAREKIQAYCIFILISTISDMETQVLGNLLKSGDYNSFSEIDALVYLSASLLSKTHDAIPALITSLENKAKSGIWVDMATTATAVILLIDTLEHLKFSGADGSILFPRIEKMIFDGILVIQKNFQDAFSQPQHGFYPWDGKASTTIKCIRAWLKFDGLLDFPVYEFIDTISKYDGVAQSYAGSKTALSFLEEMRSENNNLKLTIAEMKRVVEESGLAQKRNMLYSIALVVFLYIILVTFLGAVSIGHKDNLVEIVYGVFINGWAFHVAVLGAILTALTVPWKKIYGLTQEYK